MLCEVTTEPSVLAPRVPKLALLDEFGCLPVGGYPSDVLLAGPFEPDRFRKFPMPEEMPCAIRVRLELRAGDFSCCLSSFWSPSLSSRVFDPKLLRLVCLAELPLVSTLPGKNFLIQETWTRACFVL